MLRAIRNFFTRSAEAPSTGSLEVNDDFWFSLGGGPASSGVMVSRASAMRQWAVYSCISEIAQTLAQLPLKLKRPSASGGTEDATDHPLYEIVKSAPNPQMTSFNWRESQQSNLLTTGNNYNFIDRNIRREVLGLWPIDPYSVTPRKADHSDIGKLNLSREAQVVYDVQTISGKKTYPARDILHIVGFGWNGLVGESLITNFARESIGNAITLDQFQGKAMKNGYFPSGVFEHPDSLGDTKESFVEALDRRYAGPENARRPMVLENGMTFKVTSVSMVEKELIEQLRMSANQICGIFKVPPHRIGIFERNTNYNNTEQGNKSFLDGCMQQWVVRWEQAMNWKLLTASERRAGYCFKFNFDALLRPDAKTRSEIQWREWQTGVPLNEIRKVNDQNPVEGGDVSFVPVNMIPSHMAGMNLKVAGESQPKGGDADPKDKLLDDDISGLKTLEKNSILREVKRQRDGRSCQDFDIFLAELYAKIEGKIEDRTRTIVRCFNDEPATCQIIDSLKQDFAASRALVAEARSKNWEGIEDIWNG